MKFTAYFYTAQDARRAKNSLHRLNIDASDPIPVENKPKNGRSWALEITVGTGASSVRYQDAALADKAYEVVMDFNGTTATA